MKLYWRYKKDGKWSWKPVALDDPVMATVYSEYELRKMEEEE